MPVGSQPYCGAAPSPAELAGRWNLDPWVLAGLILAAAGWWAWRARGHDGRDLWAVGGFAALILVFVSPLCALGSALFSARIVHHAILVAVAAPLIAFAPARPWRAPPLAIATFTHAAIFWIWHAPAPYAWALVSDTAYWLMQATLLGSALAFWIAVRRAAALAAAAALLATMLQMGLLGALIALAGSPLYGPHLGTTAAWGLTPLEDQQFAGLIMWAPMAGAYLLAALFLVGRSLGDSRQAAPAR